MALPLGIYTSGNSIPAYGVSGGGAFTYTPGTSRSEFYGGGFTIDTGYDDPVAWTTGVQAAEVYGARVYGRGGYIYPAPAGGTYVGDWRVVATPVWASAFTAGGSAGTKRNRILIRCECYLAAPLSVSNGAWQRLETVDWSLYRV